MCLTMHNSANIFPVPAHNYPITFSLIAHRMHKVATIQPAYEHLFYRPIHTKPIRIAQCTIMETPGALVVNYAVHRMHTLQQANLFSPSSTQATVPHDLALFFQTAAHPHPPVPASRVQRLLYCISTSRDIQSHTSLPYAISSALAGSTLPHRLIVRHLSQIRYCQDNGTLFHHFTAQIFPFSDADHNQFIFKELVKAQAEIHEAKNVDESFHIRSSGLGPFS